MSEPIDVYADSFTITTAAYGVALTFSLQQAHPSQVSPTPPERVATIRMSLEHLKTMIFIMKRQLTRHERETGIEVGIPAQVLSQLQVAPEDWDSFWRTSLAGGDIL